MKREAVYRRCHAAVTRYVERTLDWTPRRAPAGSVAAMSYFYDVAADAGLIGDFLTLQYFFMRIFLSL